jgi:hypothetical protein
MFGHSGAAPAAVSLTTPHYATVLAHGKATGKIDGKPEDRPDTTVVPISGVKGNGSVDSPAVSILSAAFLPICNFPVTDDARAGGELRALPETTTFGRKRHATD